MTAKRMTLLFVTILIAWGLSACGRGSDRAGNIQDGPLGSTLAAGGPVDQAQITPQPQQPAEQPTMLPEAPQQTIPTNTPEPPPAVPTTPPEQPAPTEVFIPPAGDTAEALRASWSQAYQLPPGVPFAVTITEAQVEAMIAEAMAKSGYGSRVSNIDVTLNNGQIGVNFTLTISQKIGPRTVDVSGTATVIFNAAIDAGGKLVLTVASATVSAASGQSISIPPEMLTVLNVAVSEAMTGASGSAQAEATLTELTISGGTMIVKGYVTP
jgi:hypothetical protein